MQLGESKTHLIIVKVARWTAIYYAVAAIFATQLIAIDNSLEYRIQEVAYANPPNLWIDYIFGGFAALLLGAIIGYMCGFIQGNLIHLIMMICQNRIIKGKLRLLRIGIYLANLLFPSAAIIYTLITKSKHYDVRLQVCLSVFLLAASLEISRKFSKWWFQAKVES